MVYMGTDNCAYKKVWINLSLLWMCASRSSAAYDSRGGFCCGTVVSAIGSSEVAADLFLWFKHLHLLLVRELVPTLFQILQSLCLTLKPVPYSTKFLNKFDLTGNCVGWRHRQTWGRVRSPRPLMYITLGSPRSPELCK